MRMKSEVKEKENEKEKEKEKENENEKEKEKEKEKKKGKDKKSGYMILNRIRERLRLCDVKGLYTYIDTPGFPNPCVLNVKSC